MQPQIPQNASRICPLGHSSASCLLGHSALSCTGISAASKKGSSSGLPQMGQSRSCVISCSAVIGASKRSGTLTSDCNHFRLQTHPVKITANFVTINRIHWDNNIRLIASQDSRREDFFPYAGKVFAMPVRVDVNHHVIEILTYLQGSEK